MPNDAPIDPAQVKWDTPPPIDPAKVQWDAKPDTSTMHAVSEAAKDIGSQIARPVAEGVAAMPLMAMDAGVAARNLIGDVVNRISGKEATPDYEMPSQMFKESLDSVTRKPETTLGKVTEGIESAMVTPPLMTAEAKAAELMKGASIPPRELAAQAAHAAGLVIPPSYTGRTLGKTVQSLSGKAAVEREASAANEEGVDRLAKAALGMHPDDVLDQASLERLRKPAEDVYDQLAGLGRISADEEYIDEVAGAGRQFTHSAADFPGSVSPDVDKVRSTYLQQSFTARGAVDAMKQLRRDAGLDLRSGDPERISVGMVKREISEALQNRLDRQAASMGKPELVEQFKDARKLLAKINTVDDAMVGSHISAGALAKLHASKPGLLTDELATIAKTATEFPKAFQQTSKTGEWGPYSVVDLLTGLASVGGGAMGHPALLAGVVARPVARRALRSKAYQAASTTPRSQTAAAAAKKAVKDRAAPMSEEALMSTEDVGQ